MKNRIIVTCLVVILASSCAINKGTITNSTPLNSLKDYKLIDIAHGTSTSRKYLGIGGLDKSAMIAEAKKKLYQSIGNNTDLIVTNMAVDIQNRFYIIYSETNVIVSADIFSRASNADSLNQVFLDPSTYMEAGEQVYVRIRQSFIRGRLMHEFGTDKITVLLRTGKMLAIKKEEIFYTASTENYSSVYKIGDEQLVYHEGVKRRVKVVAIGSQGAIYQYNGLEGEKNLGLLN